MAAPPLWRGQGSLRSTDGSLRPRQLIQGFKVEIILSVWILSVQFTSS